MTPGDKAALRAEILSGPLASTLAAPLAIGNHSAADGSGVADILNRRDQAVLKPITVGACMKWASAGPMVRIKSASADPLKPEALKASLAVFLEILSHSRDELVDVHDAEIQAMFAAWKAANVITQAEYDAIYGDGGKAWGVASRAEIVLGRAVHHLEVAEALR